MTTILQLRPPVELRQTSSRCRVCRCGAMPALRISPIWLELRRRAVRGSSGVGRRDWAAVDFEASILTKSWWRPEALWFAETQVHAVCFCRPRPWARSHWPVAATASGKPVVHWLAVLGPFRRRRIGRCWWACRADRLRTRAIARLAGNPRQWDRGVALSWRWAMTGRRNACEGSIRDG